MSWSSYISGNRERGLWTMTELFPEPSPKNRALLPERFLHEIVVELAQTWMIPVSFQGVNNFPEMDQYIGFRRVELTKLMCSERIPKRVLNFELPKDFNAHVAQAILREREGKVVTCKGANIPYFFCKTKRMFNVEVVALGIEEIATPQLRKKREGKYIWEFFFDQLSMCKALSSLHILNSMERAFVICNEIEGQNIYAVFALFVGAHLYVASSGEGRISISGRHQVVRLTGSICDLVIGKANLVQPKFMYMNTSFCSYEWLVITNSVFSNFIGSWELAGSIFQLYDRSPYRSNLRGPLYYKKTRVTAITRGLSAGYLKHKKTQIGPNKAAMIMLIPLVDGRPMYPVSM